MLSESMLLGKYNHTIDVKNRINLPAKISEDLGDVFTVTTGREGCLLIYSQDEWSKFIGKIINAPGDTSAITRFFSSHSSQIHRDKQGRMLISAELKAYAGLSKDVVFVGCVTHVELWSRERWDAVEASVTNEVIDQQMRELGLAL